MRHVRRTIELAVSLVYWGWLACARAARRVTGRPAAGTRVVLYYHAVPDDGRPGFARQLDVLSRVATPIALSEAATPVVSNGKPRPAHEVAVTFDDGFASFQRNALPELAARRIHATVFVPSGHVGKSPCWESRNGNGLHSERLMTEAELRQLPADLVQVGSHAVSHADLVRLGPSERRTELRRSRDDLERILGRPVESFSFPYGRFDEELVEMCRSEGYRRVFTTVCETQAAPSSEFVVGRVAVSVDDWPLEFRLKSVGAYAWLATAARLKRRLLGPRGAAVTPNLVLWCDAVAFELPL